MLSSNAIVRRQFAAAQQAHEANPLIEDFIVACFGFAAFWFKSGAAAKPACGLCATVSRHYAF
jgi:hypothetical protein